MIVRPAIPADCEAVAAMCALLWPEATAEEHGREVTECITTGRSSTLPATMLVAEEARSGELAGFLQAGLRSHADGCDTATPVGFVEGWFVQENLRGIGIGRALLAAAEEWARAQGCCEMASDTWVDHDTSVGAHLALGFEVVDRCIHFRKSL